VFMDALIDPEPAVKMDKQRDADKRRERLSRSGDVRGMVIKWAFATSCSCTPSRPGRCCGSCSADVLLAFPRNQSGADLVFRFFVDLKYR
jgi:hypothetical protein